MTELKKVRTEKRMTQQAVASALGVSLRTYITYENDESKAGSMKYRFMLQELKKINPIDEEHGVLLTENIIEICNTVMPEYGVDYCYLFGSYAKGKATDSSDVDLVVSTNTKGLKFFELVEKLREGLHKKVDLLDYKQLVNNEELLNEVLKEGIKIYG